MGADAFYVYYGVRRSVPLDSPEATLLERGEHPVLHAAARAGLDAAWGRLTEGEDGFLLVGHEVGVFGIQNAGEASLPGEALRRVMEDTAARLQHAGLLDPPALHCQLDAQY